MEAKSAWNLRTSPDVAPIRCLDVEIITPPRHHESRRSCLCDIAGSRRRDDCTGPVHASGSLSWARRCTREKLRRDPISDLRTIIASKPNQCVWFSFYLLIVHAMVQQKLLLLLIRAQHCFHHQQVFPTGCTDLSEPAPGKEEQGEPSRALQNVTFTLGRSQSRDMAIAGVPRSLGSGAELHRPSQPVFRSPAAMPLMVAASAKFRSSLSSPALFRRSRFTWMRLIGST